MAEGEDMLDQVVDEVTALAGLLHHPGNRIARAQGLSPSQRGVLRRLLVSPGLTVPQLARQQGSSRQSMQVLVNRLATQNLVRYGANPDHQRSQQVHVTSAGQRALRSANRLQSAWLTELSSVVTDMELQACLSVLERMRVRLGGRNRGPSRATSTRLKSHAGVRIPSKPLAAEQPQQSAPAETQDATSPEELPISLL